VAPFPFPSIATALLIVGALLALLGCSSKPNTSSADTPTKASSEGNTVVVGGENTGSVVNGNSLNVVQDGGSLLITGNADSSGSIEANGIHYEVQGGNRLEMKNGRLLVNGKDFGPVHKGDVVRLNAEGRLWVNSQQREGTAP